MTSDFWVGRQVGQAASDFTKQAYVVKYLIRVNRQVRNTQKTFDGICEYSLGLKKFRATWILCGFIVFYADFTEITQCGFMIHIFLRNQKPLNSSPCCKCNFKLIHPECRLRPLNYYWHSQILSPSGIPELVLRSGLQSRVNYNGSTYIS